LGQACSHIGALLFLLAEHIAAGKNLPDDIASTELLCQWKDPKCEYIRGWVGRGLIPNSREINGLIPNSRLKKYLIPDSRKIKMMNPGSR